MTTASQDVFTTFLIEFGKFHEDNQKQHGTLATEMHKELRAQLYWLIGIGATMTVGTVGSIVAMGIYIANRLPASS